MTPFETVVLRDPDASAIIAPDRGGMLTRWSVGDRPLLYLDEGTLADPAQNVRGGSPVLFPSPGPLADGRFARDGRAGAMKQHGLARRRRFSVVSRDDPRVELRLESDPSTRSEYPWDFGLTLRYTVRGATLEIGCTIENRDRAPMPFAFGLHPYFLVASADASRVAIPTSATRAWDNVARRPVELDGPVDLSADEVDLHLEDHAEPEARLVLADGARVVVRASEAFGRWVIWSLRDRDFVCLEPWTAAANALNTGEDLLVVAPGSTWRLDVSFTLET